jgi:hypothetical protein
MKRLMVHAMALVALLAFTAGIAFAHDTTITLTQENNSGQNGTAVFSDLQNGTTRVTIDISGGSEVPQPAHIHAGQCGPTLNPAPAYPLSNVINGKSETVINVDLHDLTGGTFALNVHKSAAETSVYVACGNVVAMTHDESSPGMPRTGTGDTLTLLALAALGAWALTAMGMALRRRATFKGE